MTSRNPEPHDDSGDDELFEVGDPFNGDDEFRAIIVGQRTQTETREVVAGLDDEWFHENPECRARVRRYVPGEFDSDSGGFVGEPDDIVVLVRRGGVKMLFPLGSFNLRGWKAGGLR